MADIDVSAIADNRFRVTITEGGSDSSHVVTVDNEDGIPLSVSPRDLVEASFRFLLDREPKESILPSFDLSVISRYFPEYEREIGNYLG